MPELFSMLPEIVWYLTQNGKDMYCRVPYTFFFTSREAAEAFIPTLGTTLELAPVGIGSKNLVSEDGLAALRSLRVTRVFLDPEVDAASGDVHGKILRIEDAMN